MPGVSRSGPLSLTDTPYDATEFSRLWLIATTTYGVGDVVTTIALVQFSDSVGEANALLRTAIETFGLGGLIGLKLFAFFACLAISLTGARNADSALYYGPPAMLALVGAFTTVYNIRLLVG
ncbi:MAG: hypothetical protein ABEJ73_10900 [Haloplanus sp.]